MEFEITIGGYRLLTIEEVKIKRSVDALSNTATITIPGTVFNKTLSIEENLNYGDNVMIQLGYDDKKEKEFEGFLRNISVENGNIILECEDSVFLYRKDLANVELKDMSLKDVLEHITQEILTGRSEKIEINCTYNINYDKFIIHNRTAFDVLKAIQQEINPSIFIKDSVLHVHPFFEAEATEVEFDFYKNIESETLKYRSEDKQRYLITVETKGKNGQTIKKEAGTKDGTHISRYISGIAESSLQTVADKELNRLVYSGYEGYFQTWLIPYCDAGYIVKLTDKEYPEKNGKYHVLSVETNFSKSGGIRKITLGKEII